MNWPARISVKRLVIAAACARPFVRAAAAAGYEVIAADVFCDEDTRRFSLETIPLGYADGGFDAAEVRAKLLPRLKEGDTGFVYGSGFESRPALLEELAQVCPVFGNDAATVRAVKDPDVFFPRLTACEVPHPETTFDVPRPLAGWLYKRIGGSGGTHVADALGVAPAQHYFQRRMAGKPCSLLFLADGRQSVPVGYNAQWLAPSVAMPYRYGGAVSQAELPASVREGMRQAAQQLTVSFGLRGLNSLDCMVSGDAWWVLEINPRLSASFALYDVAASGANLIEAHLQASVGALERRLPVGGAHAHLIYYSNQDRIIPSSVAWPAWVADVPDAGVRIGRDEPLCTITASGEDADAAQAILSARVDVLTTLLTNFPERTA